VTDKKRKRSGGKEEEGGENKGKEGKRKYMSMIMTLGCEKDHPWYDCDGSYGGKKNLYTCSLYGLITLV